MQRNKISLFCSSDSITLQFCIFPIPSPLLWSSKTWTNLHQNLKRLTLLLLTDEKKLIKQIEKSDKLTRRNPCCYFSVEYFPNRIHQSMFPKSRNNSQLTDTIYDLAWSLFCMSIIAKKKFFCSFIYFYANRVFSSFNFQEIIDSI